MVWLFFCNVSSSFSLLIFCSVDMFIEEHQGWHGKTSVRLWPRVRKSDYYANIIVIIKENDSNIDNHNNNNNNNNNDNDGGSSGGAGNNDDDDDDNGDGPEGSGQRTRSGRTSKPAERLNPCLLYTSPSPRDLSTSRMPSSA